MVVVLLDYAIRVLAWVVSLVGDLVSWAIDNPVPTAVVLLSLVYLDYAGIYTFEQMTQDTILVVWDALKQVLNGLYDWLVNLVQDFIGDSVGV